MRSILALPLALLASCYSPNYGDGELGCAPDGTCPDGLTCNVGDQRCYQVIPVDALVEDVPDVMITFPTEGATTGAAVAVMFSSPGTEFTYECTMDQDVSSCTSGKMYTLASGSHTLSVRAIGPFGTPGNASSVTWNVDTNAATVTITGTPADMDFTTSKSASFTFTAEPSDFVEFECKIDAGSFAPCTSPQSLSTLAEGPHSFAVQATRLGSVSSATRTWTVDSLAPMSPTFSGTPTNGALVTTTAANFSFSAVDATTITYECSRDGAAFASCTSPQTYNVTGDGSHSFSVRAKDEANNTTVLGSASWTVDATPPNTTLTQNIITATNQTSVTFTYSSNEAGATFVCSLDGTARTCTGTSHTISGLAVGNHTFSIAARDQAGNLDATPATHSFSVTNSPVLQYKFDFNADNTGAASNTPVSYNGTATNVSYAGGGKFGGGVTFASSATSFATLPVAPLIHTGRPYTVSLWWREATVRNDSDLISFPGTNRLDAYHSIAGGNNLTTCVTSVQCSSFSYTPGPWNNLIFRYAGAGSGVQVYVNGALQHTLTGYTGDLFGALGNPTVGKNTNMTVDEIRFYDQVYSTATQCTQVIGGTWNGQVCTLP